MTSGKLLSLIKCGCLTGVLWSLSQMLLVIVANELGILARTGLQTTSGNWYFLLDILAGVLAITFYAALRAVTVTIPRATIVTVFVWLFIQTLTGLKGGELEYTIPIAVLMSLLSVIAMSLCVLAGAWPYEVISSTKKQPAPSTMH